MPVRFAPPRLRAEFIHVGHPLADCSFADSESGGDSALFPTLPPEFERSFAPRFFPIVERDAVLPHTVIMTQGQNFPDLCNDQ